MTDTLVAPGAVPAAQGGEPHVALALVEGTTRDSAERRSAALDAVRAIAALMVLGMHANALVGDGDAGGAVHQLRYHLWTGVDLFFALSGYLIAGPFLRALATGERLPGTAAYAVRRAARILPAYWVALTVLLITAAPGGMTSGSVFLHYTLLHDWFPGESRNLYPVAWTLGIEALFYLLVPLGALWLRARYPGPIAPATLCRWILGVAAAALAWDVVWGYAFDHVGFLLRHPDAHSVITDNIPAQLALFCPGMLLAVLTMPRRTTAAARTARTAPWWTLREVPGLFIIGAAGLLWVVGIGVGGGHGHVAPAVRDDLFMPLAAGLAVYVFLRGGEVIALLSRVLAPFGVISYGIYLWQWAALQWLLDRGVGVHLGQGRTVDFAVAYLVIAAVTLPIALASWILVERPILRRAARWAKRHRVSPVEPGPGDAGPVPALPADPAAPVAPVPLEA